METSQKPYSANEEYLRSLVLEFIPQFPNEIITDIVDHLNEKYINDVFLYLPSFKQAITPLYHAKELHFVLSPTSRPYVTHFPLLKRPTITLYPLSSIEDFLQTHPDIIPRKLLLVAGTEYESLHQLMEKYRTRLSNPSTSIEITLENYPLTAEDINFLLSFPNIHRLHFSRISLMDHGKPILDNDNSVITTYTSLKEIVFLGTRIIDWSHIQFSPNVSHLDISWNSKVDANSINIPRQLEELYFNSLNINTDKLVLLRLPPTLKNLTLTHNQISSFPLSVFPRTLENLDISANEIRQFEIDDDWPPNLSAILMSTCDLDDTILEQLKEVPWPQNLKYLVLNGNDIHSLDCLGVLPEGLEQLDLQYTKITSFKVYSDESHYYQFPNSLEVLRFGSTKFWFDPSFDDDRFEFPPNLVELDLSDCKIDSLKYFKFPESLQTLLLSHNKIKDIGSYNSSSLNINWKDLIGLKNLSIYHNLISNASLQHWIPPENLESLYCHGNSLEKIDNSLALFNDQYAEQTSHLKVIDFSNCIISQFDRSVVLPKNLETLNLNRNILESVYLTEKMMNHGHLRHLDLKLNVIKDIQFEVPHGNSKLMNIDLSNNLLLANEKGPLKRQLVSEFYDKLQKGIGKQVKTQRYNTNSNHEFI